MFTCFFTMLVLSMGISLVMTFSPLAMGFWILLMSMMVSVLMGSTFSSWFGFIMFLIYIGGMLVMFAYFVAIQPNQQFDLKSTFFFLLLCMFNMPINMYPVLLNLIPMSNWWISSLFYMDNMMMVVLLGLVLFLALVMVVKITALFMATLRPFKVYV